MADVVETNKSIHDRIKETNTCSSSDTDSDMDVEYRKKKRMKLKMRPKSPVKGYYKKSDIEGGKKELKYSDRYTENQLDCSFGREAMHEMYSTVNSDTEEG